MAVPTPADFDLQPDFEPYDDDVPASVGAPPANMDNAPVIPVPEAVGAGAPAIPAPEAVGADEIPVEPARAQRGRPPGPRQPAPPPTRRSTQEIVAGKSHDQSYHDALIRQKESEHQRTEARLHPQPLLPDPAAPIPTLMHRLTSPFFGMPL